VGSSHTPLALPALLRGVALCLAATAHGQPATRSPYTEAFYPSAGLRIHAYLYRPDGPGPFPVVIYNHGSRVGREWQPMPFEHIGGLLTRAGYVTRRVGIMGWSFGGIVTMFAVSRSEAFAVAIDQAGGALTWNGNPSIRGALTAAASRTTTPTLLQVAENDRTTDSITTLGAILQKREMPHGIAISAPFGPAQALRPGALEFLGRHLGPDTPKR